MAPRAKAPSDEPQERFKVVPETLTTAEASDFIAGCGTAAKRLTDVDIEGFDLDTVTGLGKSSQELTKVLSRPVAGLVTSH